MKFKLQRDNEYDGNVLEKRYNYVMSMTAGILSGLLIGFGSLGYMAFNKGGYTIKNFALNIKYSIMDIIDDDYSNLSNEEKNSYVVNFFCDCIDRKDNLSIEQKNYLKEYVSKFLSDWGCLYAREDLVKMEAAISNVNLYVNNRLYDTLGCDGVYAPELGVIYLDDVSNKSALAHEFDHVITYDPLKYSFESLIEEAITSSIDYTYYNYSSYNSLIRNQMLFLSEIVGRENLLKCYISSDYNYLIELIGEDNKDLLDLFDKEIISIRNNLSTSDDISLDIVNKLERMYEEKYGKRVEDDAIMYIVRESCLPNSLYDVKETLFYEDEFCYYYDDNKCVLSVGDRDNIFNNISSDRLYGYENALMMYCIKNNYCSGGNMGIDNQNNMIISLFGEEVFYEIMNSDDSIKIVRDYLKLMGIEDYDLTLYNILYNNLDDEEVAILYCNEFKRLYNENKIDIGCANINLVVGGDRAKNVLKIICDNDSGLSYEELSSCLGYYYEYRDYNDNSNSIVRYNYFFDGDSIILPNNGMNYWFLDDCFVTIYPEVLVIDNNYVQYKFNNNRSTIYILGNVEEHRLSKLEEFNNNNYVKSLK